MVKCEGFLSQHGGTNAQEVKLYFDKVLEVKTKLHAVLTASKETGSREFAHTLAQEMSDLQEQLISSMQIERINCNLTSAIINVEDNEIKNIN